MMTRRDDLRKRDPTSPDLPRLDYDIHNRIYAQKRQTLRDCVETLDQKTDVTKLWRTIKGIDGRAKREADNVAITFNGSSFSSSKQLAARFNQQFNTSKLGRHTSSSETRLVTSETRLVTRETKRKSLEMAQTFTTDLVRRAIKSCRNSKAFGPDKLSIFHLKNLGTSHRIQHRPLQPLSHDLSDSGDMEVFIDHPNTETWQGHLRINFVSDYLDSCPDAKVLEYLILPTINKYIQPAPDQHGFRPDHSSTSALLQMTTDIAMGFNQRKPHDRTICVAVDLSAAFDTVYHNNLLAKINRSQLPPGDSCHVI